jgi:hypothetical protein
MYDKKIVHYLSILQQIIKTKDMEELIDLVTSMDYTDEDNINEIIESLSEK